VPSPRDEFSQPIQAGHGCRCRRPVPLSAARPRGGSVAPGQDPVGFTAGVWLRPEAELLPPEKPKFVIRVARADLVRASPARPCPPTCSPFRSPLAIAWPLGRAGTGLARRRAFGSTVGAVPGGALPGGVLRRCGTRVALPFVAARWASLTELCANIPQPHQVAAPGVPSIRERAHP
jgi:hypothetical protein